ncbi:hypothetical protein Mapa_001796 [Marchantia paleacea]|nr:hypothetical protein Mapa_001796 [Marchantia paleacea]
MILHKCGLPYFASETEKLIKHLKTSHKVKLGPQKLKKCIIVFKDAVLDTITGRVEEFSPDRFCNAKLPYNIGISQLEDIPCPDIPGDLCPTFTEFVDSFTGGKDDLMKFIRAYFNRLLRSEEHGAGLLLRMLPRCSPTLCSPLVTATVRGDVIFGLWGYEEEGTFSLHMLFRLRTIRIPQSKARTFCKNTCEIDNICPLYVFNI